MQTSTKIVLITLAVVLIGIIIYVAKGGPIASIKGCYVAKLDKDVYTLNITSQKLTAVEGTLAYKNFEKDSSSGALVGTFNNNILLADYSFQSEGTDSVRQVIFKKDGDKFIEGFGPVEIEDGKETFINPENVTFESAAFVKSEECGK
jgi:hypothetical protein